MKSVQQFLRKLLTIETAVHIVMILFAGASVANIASLFIEGGHAIVGWVLGCALGSALVAVSIMATKIDRQVEPLAFRYMVVAVTALALLSGAIQSKAYALHLPLIWAIVLGYGMPLCGEALLAFATAEYTAAYRRKRIRSATDGSKEKIAEAIAEALSDIDVSEVKSDVQRQVKSIVKYQVGQIAAEMMGKNVADVRNVPVTPTPEPRQTLEMSQSNAPVPVSTNDMTKVRTDKAATRRQEILSYVDSQDVRTFVESMAQLFDVSVRTIQRDIQSLESDGKVIANGVIVLTENLVVS